MIRKPVRRNATATLHEAHPAYFLLCFFHLIALFSTTDTPPDSAPALPLSSDNLSLSRAPLQFALSIQQ
jgi:hypothetical protein